MKTRCSSPPIAIVLVALLATPAGAEEALHALRREGEACYRRRDYRCALEKFELVMRRRPAAENRFNLASAQDKLGLASLAVVGYRLYLKEAGASAPSVALAHIQRRMAELGRRVAVIQLRLSPPDASVACAGSTPLVVAVGSVELVVMPGTVRVQVTRDGFLPRSEALTVSAGETRGLELTLRRARRDGALAITSHPPGAVVWLDGKRLARPTPLQLSGVADGKHSVEVEAPEGCFKRTLTVTAGEEAQLHATLSAGGVITVQADPRAGIEIDGQPATAESRLLLGEHVVAVRLPGHRPWTRRVRLGCAALNVILRPELERVTVLELKTNPAGAALSVDGTPAGRTPVSLSLRAGGHRLMLTRPGFLPLERSVDLRSGTSLALGLALIPTPETERVIARRSRKGKLALGGLIAAGASLVAMSVLYGVGKKSGDDAYAEYRAATLDADRETQATRVRAADRMMFAGHGCAALSAAALGFSLYHLLSRGSLPPPAP